MKNVSNDFKVDIRTYGRQLDFKIKVNNIENDIDNFNYLKPAFHADLFKTVMHELEIDSKNKLEKKTKINIEPGIKLNEPVYEYISYNTYSIEKCERQEDTNSYICLAYDKMVEAMIDYDLELNEKIPLREYLIKVCQRLGWSTDNIPATFINSEKLVDPNLHRGIKYSFRDTLDEIATLSCSALLFINDEFYLLYPVVTSEVIDESYLDEDSVMIGEKYFINSLVFSRAEESDNIYRKDDTSIRENGLHEFRIADNQLLSTNDRDLYIEEMWSYLKTFEFYPFDVKSKGILFLEPYDKFSFKLNGNTYPTILLNSEVAFEDGISEYIYSEEPPETETDYKYADTTDRRANQTYFLVDKQNQLIQSIIEVAKSLDNNIDVLQADLRKKIEDLGENLKEYQVAISTQFKQTEIDYTFLFNTIIENINSSSEGTNEKFAEITDYIRFVNGNIILGKSDSELTLKIQNNRISFLQNESEVAYISDNKLFITKGEFLESLQLGNFAFIPRSNGNLSFKKVGGS